MPRTVAEAVTSARATLNDTDSGSYRHPTSELEGYALDAVNMIRNLRPDLFIGNWGELAALTGNAPLPINAQFFRPVVDYMVARTESKEDEDVNAGRAELMAKLAGGFLT